MEDRTTKAGYAMERLDGSVTQAGHVFDDPLEVVIDGVDLEQRVFASLNATLKDLMPLRTLLIGITYAVLAIVNLVVVPSESRMEGVLLALAVSLVFLGLTVGYRLIPIANASANALSFVEIVILQADGLAFLLLTNDMMNSFGVYVLIISAGIFLTNVRWICVSVTMLCGSWLLLRSLTTLEFQGEELLMMLSSIISCAFFYYMRRRSAVRLCENQIRQDIYQERLEKALRDIETLSGLLPICAGCKSIRDEQDSWSPIEDYVSSHSAIEFTHSFCPDCMVKFYPDYVDTTTS